MSEYDWIKKLIRGPVDQNTLDVFADWLEERGDKRSEEVRKSGISSVYSFQGSISSWKMEYPRIPADKDKENYAWISEEHEAWKELANRIAKYFVWTDED